MKNCFAPFVIIRDSLFTICYQISGNVCFKSDIPIQTDVLPRSISFCLLCNGSINVCHSNLDSRELRMVYTIKCSVLKAGMLLEHILSFEKLV